MFTILQPLICFSPSFFSFFLFVAGVPNFSVYGNTLSSGWADWSFASDYSFSYTNVFHSASNSIRFVPKAWEVCRREKRDGLRVVY